MKSIASFALVAVLSSVFLLAGCSDQKKSPSSPTTPADSGKPAEKPGHHDGKPLDLGSGNAGPFAIRASRDEGAIKAGGDAPIDVWVNSGPKVTAVRFWIGTEDAKGSVKALAELEDPAQPNHYHTHAEVPATIPAGSKLWVEIEGEAGAKGAASFDLKM